MNLYLPIRQLRILRDEARRAMDWCWINNDARVEQWVKIHARLQRYIQRYVA